MFKWLFGGGAAHRVYVKDGDRQIDLYPVAEEVIEKAPEPCGMDALRLAELARERFDGRYVRVGEYPDEIDTAYAKLIVGRVVAWARWQRKAEGFERSSGRFIHKVEAGKGACPKMRRKIGKPVSKDKIERLPLDDCWQNCMCWYKSELRR